MRFAIIALGSRGDVQPHIALGAGLQDAGHDVCLVTHALFESSIRRLGLGFSPIEINPRELVENEMGQAWLGSGNNFLFFFQRFSRLAEPLILQVMNDCWQACESVDAIVTSPLGICVAASVAQKLGVPCWIGAGQPLTPTNYFAIPFFPDAPSSLPIGRSSYNHMTYMLSMHIFWRLIRPSINKARQKILNLTPLHSNWLYEQVLRQRFPMLYYFSPSVLPQPPDWSNNNHVTGYWFLDDDQDWRPPAALLEFLRSGPAPVYVGFGSMRSPKSGEMTNIVLHALARTRQRGILVTGWGGISNVNLPEDVYMIDFVPHNWLFPQMAAVVHHGGAGTMAASVRAGVPTIMIPFFGDQPFWGRRYFALGITPKPIPQKHLTVERLVQAIHIAISDEDIRSRLAVLNKHMNTENGVARAIEILEKCSWP
jgi:sterol 3beta-glucosyltransferase